MPIVRNADDIGSAIAAARKARGMSQAQLAELSGVKQPKVSEIERGKHTAHIGIALRMIAALGLLIDVREPGSTLAADPAKPSALRLANVVFDEPLPDDSIDLDAIVGSKPKATR